MLRHPCLHIQKVRVLSFMGELSWRLQPSLSIRVIYDPETEESITRFFKMHFKRSLYLTQKFNKFIGEHQAQKQCKKLCCLPATMNSWSNYQRVTKIWGPLPLWEHCWTGSAYSTRLLLAPLSAPTTTYRDFVWAALHLHFETLMGLSHRHLGLVSHKWYAQHIGFPPFPLWI